MMIPCILYASIILAALTAWAVIRYCRETRKAAERYGVHHV